MGAGRVFGWSAVACGILGQERDSLNLFLFSDNVDVLDIRTGRGWLFNSWAFPYRIYRQVTYDSQSQSAH